MRLMFPKVFASTKMPVNEDGCLRNEFPCPSLTKQNTGVNLGVIQKKGKFTNIIL